MDTSPDFRQQALRHGIDRLDAVLFTHSHADHIMGLDDVRRFNHIQGAPLPCYATRGDVERTCARPSTTSSTTSRARAAACPRSWPHVIDGPLAAGGMRFVPVPLWHGRMPVLGFRTGDFAYLTDCNRLDDAAWPLLDGLDTLVLDALRDKPHATHFTLAEALEVVRRLAPRRAYLTHMTHDLGHQATSARLPAGVQLAYDGLVIDVAVVPGVNGDHPLSGSGPPVVDHAPRSRLRQLRRPAPRSPEDHRTR